MQRSDLIQGLAEIILRISKSHPVRVAIDGVDAAGKTTLADELNRASPRKGQVGNQGLY